MEAIIHFWHGNEWPLYQIFGHIYRLLIFEYDTGSGSMMYA